MKRLFNLLALAAAVAAVYFAVSQDRPMMWSMIALSWAMMANARASS